MEDGCFLFREWSTWVGSMIVEVESQWQGKQFGMQDRMQNQPAIILRQQIMKSEHHPSSIEWYLQDYHALESYRVPQIW